MILQKLTTKNFKRLGTAEFTFTDGLNFILGRNGAGKSTLTRAIATALYGVSALPGVSDDVATWGQGSWSVSLTFELDGKGYEVSRTKSSASLHCGGNLIASGNTPVTQEIEQLFRLPIKDYYLFVHSRQGETAYILKYGATALQRKVEEFSGVDLIDQLQTMARERAKGLQQQADNVYLLSTDEVDMITQRSVELQDELSKPLVDAPNAPNVDLDALRKGFRAYTTHLSELRSYSTEKELLESQLADLVVPEQPKPVDDLETELKSLTDAVKKSAEAKARESALEAQLGMLVRPEKVSEPENKDGVAALEDKVAELSTQVAELQVKQRDLTKAINSGVCSSCGTILAENLEEHKAELEKVKLELSTVRESLEKSERELAVLKKQVAAYIAFKKAEDNYEAAKADLAVKLSSVEAVEFDEERLMTVRGILKDHEAAVSAYNTAASRKAKLERQLTNLSSPSPVPLVTADDVETAEKLWNDYAKDKESYTALLNVIDQQKDELGRHQHTLEQYQLNLRKQVELEAKSEKFQRLSAFLATRRNEYLQQVWDNIMLRSSELLKYMTSDWLTGVKVVDGKFLFEEEGVWIAAVEASGAQAAFIGTAVRLAMNRVLYGNESYLIFDEPTADMTEENSRALVAGIAGAAKQVFVVTHRESDQGLADSVVEVG